MQPASAAALERLRRHVTRVAINQQMVRTEGLSVDAAFDANAAEWYI